MNVNSKLKTIASFVAPEDIVIDMCCDHAYLAIYLKQNNICKQVFASDISEAALNQANQNIINSGVKIKTFRSDGFKDFYESSINTAIIAGVGTNTALDIVVNAPDNVVKFIISSNNNHPELRKKMLEYGYYVQKEEVVIENGMYYPIMLFDRTFQQESEFTLEYGKSNNRIYFRYLLQKEQEILEKIPKREIFKRMKHEKKIAYLKSFDMGPIN